MNFNLFSNVPPNETNAMLFLACITIFIGIFTFYAKWDERRNARKNQQKK